MRTDVEHIRRKYEVMSLVLDERQLRLYVAAIDAAVANRDPAGKLPVERGAVLRA
jgi:hypothetical protein